MDLPHLHLVLNHFPIIGSIIGLLVLIFGLLARNRSVINTALGILIGAALIGIGAFLTGEPAEHQIEGTPGIVEAVVEEHEHFAEIAFWVMIATGAFALLAFVADYRHNKSIAHMLRIATLIMAVVTTALMINTGNLGGKIRHAKIAAANGQAEQPASIPQMNNENQEEDEDDD